MTAWRGQTSDDMEQKWLIMKPTCKVVSHLRSIAWQHKSRRLWATQLVSPPRPVRLQPAVSTACKAKFRDFIWFKNKPIWSYLKLILNTRQQGFLFWCKKTFYLQVKIKFSQKEHEGVEFLLSLSVSPDSHVPLLILFSTSTGDNILSFNGADMVIAGHTTLHTDLRSTPLSRDLISAWCEPVITDTHLWRSSWRKLPLGGLTVRWWDK